MTLPKKPITPERKKELEASRQRMKEIKRDLKKNDAKLDEYLGLKKGIVHNVMSMKNAIFDNFAKALTDKRPEYYYEWVMSGTGPKTKTSDIAPKKKVPVKIKPVEKIEPTQSQCKGCIDKDYIITELKRIIEEKNKTIERLRL